MYKVSLSLEFVLGILHHLLAVVGHREPVNHGVLAALAGDGEGEDEALVDALLVALGVDAHTDPLAGPELPVLNVVDGRTAGRGCGGRAAELDDLRAALLDARGEGALHPGVVVDGFKQVGTADLAGLHLGVHGRAVVAEDRDVLDVAHVGVELEFELRQRPVVVESAHRGDRGFGQTLELAGGDQAVSVARVADDYRFQVFVGDLVEGHSYVDEDLPVVLDQVGAFHAFSPWF